MQISVVGCGYLGAVHAASLVELGHDVVGIDIDERRVAALSQGRSPFFEPGFQDLLDHTLASGRLRFSNDMADAVAWIYGGHGRRIQLANAALHS